MRRLALVVLALAACSKGKTAATQGSGSPPAAAPVTLALDAAIAPAVDAALAAASTPTLSAKGGLSTLGRFDWSKQDEDANTKLIQDKIGLPGVTVSFGVMDVPGDVEREEGYWSVKRGDKELVQVLREEGGAPEGPGPAAVIVWTADVATVDGIKVGDKVSALLAKHPDLVCKLDHEKMIAETVAADLVCRTSQERELEYIVDAQKKKLKPGQIKPAALSDLGIVAIAHEF